MHIQSYTGSHLISYLMLGIPNCELERRKGKGNDSCGKCSHRFSSFPLWAKFSFLLPLKPVGATGSFVPGPSSSAFALQWLFGRKISDILHDNEGLGRAGRKMLGKVQISRLHEKDQYMHICIKAVVSIWGITLSSSSQVGSSAERVASLGLIYSEQEQKDKGES